MAEPSTSRASGVEAELREVGKALSALELVRQNLDTVGLFSVILGTASRSQNLGPLPALAVGADIALAGLWSSPISGASMNPARGKPGRGSGPGRARPAGGRTRRGPSGRAPSS